MVERVNVVGESEEKSQEEVAIVLDFLPNGYPDKTSRFRGPIIQALGKFQLSLLELSPKKDVVVQPHDEVYIGSGKRDQVNHILGRLNTSKLTGTAKAELEFIVNKLVESDESRFVKFFNEASPLSARMHSLELIPGMGKKRMWEFLEERRVKPFESFEDIKKRVNVASDPKKSVVKRILIEIQNKDEKHKLFVK